MKRSCTVLPQIDNRNSFLATVPQASSSCRRPLSPRPLLLVAGHLEPRADGEREGGAGNWSRGRRMWREAEDGHRRSRVAGGRRRQSRSPVLVAPCVAAQRRGSSSNAPAHDTHKGGAMRSFSVADLSWYNELDCHIAKMSKSVGLKKYLEQIFNCTYKRGK